MICNRCHTNPCKCPEPFLGIYESDLRPGVVTFNMDGKTFDWNGRHFVNSLQTDTTLVTDVIARLLRYTAERHTDTITAKELGSILHLADLGDVDAGNFEQGSLLTYKKNNNCAEGCVGTQNHWEGWNALDNQTTSMTLPMGADADGNLVTLAPPPDPEKTYFLGWDGKRQVSYFTVIQSATKPANGGQVYYDADLQQLVWVREG